MTDLINPGPHDQDEIDLSLFGSTPTSTGPEQDAQAEPSQDQAIGPETEQVPPHEHGTTTSNTTSLDSGHHIHAESLDADEPTFIAKLKERFMESRGAQIVSGGLGAGILVIVTLSLAESDKDHRGTDLGTEAATGQLDNQSGEEQPELESPVVTANPVGPADTISETPAETEGLGLSLTRELPGDEFVLMTWNNETYRIPKLRDPLVDVNAFAESALALWACYLTTGNEECLNEFTSDHSVKQALKDQRDQDYAPFQATGDGRLAQANFIDSLADPAVFVLDTSSAPPVVHLAGGTLMYGQEIYDQSWQNLSSDFRDLQKQITDLRFGVFAVDIDGSPDYRVNELHWDSTDR